ncbi:trna delta -isopentenylpyrophosphate transferase [Bradyrhizobium denitrificans]
MARRNPKLDKIYDVFEKHKVEIDRDSIWEVQGTPVVKHKDVERLGAAIGIKWTKPDILRAERDEAVILVMGEANGKTEWSIGEALISYEGKAGGNYKVKGKMAAYPYAMAEKRAKDRVILKLADLHGDAYSSEEADDFDERERGDRRDDRDDRRDDRRASNDNDQDGQKSGGDKRIEDMIVKAETDIRNCKSIKEVTDLMNCKDMKAVMDELSKQEVADLRSFATQRLKDLGWTKPAKDKEAANG